MKPVILWGFDAQKIMYTLSYISFFQKVRFWEKVILGRPTLRGIVMTQYGHYVNLPLKPGSHPGPLR